MAAHRLGAGDRVPAPRGGRAPACRGPDRRGGEPRPLRPGLHPRADGQSARRSSYRPETRAGTRIRRWPHGLHAGLAARSVRDGDTARRQMADFENLVRLAQAFGELDSPGGADLRARGPTIGLAPPRHGVRAATLRTSPTSARSPRAPTRPNHDPRIGEILFGGRQAIKRAPVSISLINVDSPFATTIGCSGRSSIRQGRSSRRSRPVPAHASHVAGVAARHAGPAGSARGVRRDRVGAADPPRCAGRLRIVPVRYRTCAVGSPSFGTPRIGRRGAVHRADRRRYGLSVAWRRGRLADRRHASGLRIPR